MKFFFSLRRVAPETLVEFYSLESLRRVSCMADELGFDGCAVTDHPAPGIADVELGLVEHAADPFVVLSVVAALTTRLRVHTRVLILPYRNPFLTAKAIATLDFVSGGRVVVGVGLGYLESEFQALGVDFAERSVLTDESIRIMKQVWAGDPVVSGGMHFRAPGTVVLPLPCQGRHPPIWVGGNSRRAIRRAVELGDGWLPFPNTPGRAAVNHSDVVETLDDLRARIDFMREYAESVGRSAQPEISLVQPPGWWARDGVMSDPARILDQVAIYASLGVTTMQVQIPGATCDEFVENLEWFGLQVLAEAEKI